jgi:hypothetical protein
VDTFLLGAFSGSINAAGDTVILDSGDQIEIIAGSTDHAARFIATPSNGDRTIGIVIFETAIGDLPTGSVSYTGTSAVRSQHPWGQIEQFDKRVLLAHRNH